MAPKIIEQGKEQPVSQASLADSQMPPQTEVDLEDDDHSPTTPCGTVTSIVTDEGWTGVHEGGVQPTPNLVTTCAPNHQHLQ